MIHTLQVLLETLRIYPPVNVFSKEAPKGLKLSGYDIPEGTAIMVSHIKTLFWVFKV